MHRAEFHRIGGRGMAGLALESDAHGHDAAVCQHRLRLGGFGDDGFRKPMLALQEGRNAARVVGFLVACKKKCDRPCSQFGSGKQARSGALDIASAQANGAVGGDPKPLGVGGPRRRAGQSV